MPYLDLGDASVFYDVNGTGEPAIVLVHGALCSHRDWSHQVTELSRTYTVVTLDLRGHGSSTASFASCTIDQFAADIHSLIDSLGIMPAVLVGHSMGARVVLEATTQRPENVAGLVLLDGSRFVGSAPLGADEHASRLTDQQVLTNMSQTIEDAIGPYADATIRAHVSTTMLSAPVGLMRAVLAALQDWDNNRYDGAMAALPPGLPVSAIQSTRTERGARRQCLTTEVRITPYLDYLRHHLPLLDAVILPDTGHFSMLEAPILVSRIIASTVATTRDAQSSSQ